MNDKLVIVPCGKSKIWDDGITKGPVKAVEAYTGAMFKLGVQFAKSYNADLIILSAKYGYMWPETLVEPYDVSFIRKTSNPISHKELYGQATFEHKLMGYSEVLGLGGAEYRKAIQSSFIEYKGHLWFPLAGLSIGYYLKHLKQAIQDGCFCMEGFYVKNGRPSDAGMFDDDL